MIVFETKIFEYTGTNICIGFFNKKKKPKSEKLEFKGIKIKNNNRFFEKKYILKPEFKYRAGSEFDEFLAEFCVNKPLTVHYYLLKEDVLQNEGSNEISVIDANDYQNNKYKTIILHVNNNLKKRIVSSILYVRTVDTGSYDGRVGLGIISEDFNVNGILVSGNTYRTHPIQIFFEPIANPNEQNLLRKFFNFILEVFREKLDSDFLTTYKYSDADYTRKYLGLTQVRRLIQIFPFSELNEKNKEKLNGLINNKDFNGIFEFLKACKDKRN